VSLAFKPAPSRGPMEPIPSYRERAWPSPLEAAGPAYRPPDTVKPKSPTP
jgi:hypothetical protein